MFCLRVILHNTAQRHMDTHLGVVTLHHAIRSLKLGQGLIVNGDQKQRTHLVLSSDRGNNLLLFHPIKVKTYIKTLLSQIKSIISESEYKFYNT